MNDISEYNFYGDESCYLQSDDSQYMVLGTIYCEKQYVKQILKDIKQIKVEHGLPNSFEIKSTKISMGKYDFYKDLVTYFLESKLKFRTVIIDKSILNHKAFRQTHDDFYYKMYYELFSYVIYNGTSVNIYLDYKDTNSKLKTDKLTDILNTKFQQCNVKTQIIDSKESNLLQLSDLLIGLTCYSIRGLQTNEAKLKLIDLLQSSLGFTLTRTNFINKFNILRWKPYV